MPNFYKRGTDTGHTYTHTYIYMSRKGQAHSGNIFSKKMKKKIEKNEKKIEKNVGPHDSK